MYGRGGGGGSVIGPGQYLLALRCMQQHSQPSLPFWCMTACITPCGHVL